MKIALTGSSGFIGSHLKQKLEKDGHQILEWDLKSGRDIADFGLENAEFVIHLAAIADVRASIAAPDKYWVNNVEHTTRIQRTCYFNRVPLIYASSSCVHAWHKSPYGTSKKVNEETAFYGQIALRFTTVYGEGARDTMFISKLMKGELKYATNHIRDFIHVDDVIHAIELIMLKMTDPHLFPETILKSAYDIGCGVGNVVADIAKTKMPFIEIREGHECESPNNTADNIELKKLGWQPTISVIDYVQMQ